MLENNGDYHRFEISRQGDKNHRIFLDHEKADEPKCKSKTRRIAEGAGLGAALALGACVFDSAGLAAPDAHVDARPIKDGSLDASDGPVVDADLDAALLDARLDAAPDSEVPDAALDSEVPDAEPDAYVPLTETNCDDGVDEDLDGDTDCSDTDCIADATCIACNDIFVDLDGDNKTGCAEESCQFSPSCIPTGTGGCTDPQNGLKRGAVGEFCYPDGQGAYVSYEVICNDGIDNDNDGLTDSNDADCAAFSGPQEICTNRDLSDLAVDEHNDGLANGEAPDCSFHGRIYGAVDSQGFNSCSGVGTCVPGTGGWGDCNTLVEICMPRDWSPTGPYF